MHFYQESPPPLWGRVGAGWRSLAPLPPSSSPTGGEEYFLDILSRAGSPITPIRRCVRGTHPTGKIKLFIAFALDFFRNLFERSYIFKAGLGRARRVS